MAILNQTAPWRQGPSLIESQNPENGFSSSDICLSLQILVWSFHRRSSYLVCSLWCSNISEKWNIGIMKLRWDVNLTVSGATLNTLLAQWGRAGAEKIERKEEHDTDDTRYHDAHVNYIHNVADIIRFKFKENKGQVLDDIVALYHKYINICILRRSHHWSGEM